MLWSIPHRRPLSARRPLRSCRLSGESLESRQTPASLTLAGLLPDPNPQVGSGFGSAVVALPNGNVVVSAPFQDVGAVVDAGAVYLFHGETRKLLTTLTGAAAGDRVGSGGITALANGDYVVSSPHWDLGKVEDAGAVTWQSGKPPFGTPLVVPVSVANSLHGTSPYDWVGISSSYTFVQNYPHDGYGENPPTPDLTFKLFDAVTPLPNGNYVVSSPWWNNVAAVDAGAVTLLRGNGGMPAAGGAAGAAVGGGNSLYGTSNDDYVGSGYQGPLLNGPKSGSIPLTSRGVTVISAPGATKYVVASPSWTWTLPGSDPVVDAGAVTLVDGGSGMVKDNEPERTGIGVPVTDSNSLHGDFAEDSIGNGGVTPLVLAGIPTGNYVVCSPMDTVFWSRNGKQPLPGDGGAVTWVDQEGCVRDSVGGKSHGAVVSGGNSLIGRVIKAADGSWAVSSNELIGSHGVVPLPNGNYVVASSWAGYLDPDKAVYSAAGAVTFGDGASGARGEVDDSNSVFGGKSPQGMVGSGGITPLPDGSYFIISPLWNTPRTGDGAGKGTAAKIGVGAVTWVDKDGFLHDESDRKTLGGVIYSGSDPSKMNSLVGVIGSDEPLYPERGDSVGKGGITPVKLNGGTYYAVVSPNWNLPQIGTQAGPALRAGAVTLLNEKGRVVIVDPVKPTTLLPTRRGTTVNTGNSLHGDRIGDAVGSGGVTPLQNGNFVVASPAWRSGIGLQGPGTSGGGGSTGEPKTLGAATWVGRLPNGTFRGIGSTSNAIVNQSNSLVGVADRDRVSGGGVVALANGNYVVVSPDVDISGARDAGAVTWGSGSTGAVGQLLSGTGRSLTGSQTDDKVGSGGVTPLVDGAYVVASPSWDNPSVLGSDGSQAPNNDAGAVTRVAGDGLLSPTVATANAVVSIRNCLVGSAVNDQVGSGGVTALQGGNFLVRSDAWGVVSVNGEAATDLGAVTWVQGGAARGATVGPKNSAFGKVTEAGIVRDDARGRFLIGLREQTSNGRLNQRVVIGLQSAGFSVTVAAEPSLADQPTSMARAAAVTSPATKFAALGAESATSAKPTITVRAAKATPAALRIVWKEIGRSA